MRDRRKLTVKLWEVAPEEETRYSANTGYVKVRIVLSCKLLSVKNDDGPAWG